MIFSHGLGGSRNAYSHLAGSVASHGVIVIAPEHRDGSSPISYIRDVPSNNSITEKSAARKSKRTVDYIRLPHTPSPEVEVGRNAQLKVRLWELGAIHDSILKLDLGEKLENLNTSSTSLHPFKDLMDVHTPGRISFAGHSFGGATVAQFIKSTFYSPETSEAPSSYEPLFLPSSRSAITKQITLQTPLILLDVWMFPLRAASTKWLWGRPLPCYTPGGPGGSALLAIESQAFYKWSVHLKATKRLLSPNPASLEDNYTKQDGGKWSEPNFFYANASAHLSQSDFGLLFPWVTKRFLAVEEPERVMRLNVRAILQLLRTQGIPVSATSAEDMELSDKTGVETNDDTLILAKKGVRAWNWLSTNVEEDCGNEGVEEVEDAQTTEPSDAVVGNELMKQTIGTSDKISEPPSATAKM
jgi:platelet-activating factor acetylhydrolase